MRPCLLLLLVLAPALAAQQIDRTRSGFVSAPHGRPGTCAPFRVVFEAPQGSTATVESRWGNVVLTRQVAVAASPAQALLPVFVDPGAEVVVRAGEATDAFRPTLPPRLLPADYNRLYAAVFSRPAEAGRLVLPPEPGVLAADYFETGEFFTDWRLFDGYDAIVVFNPDDVRLPAGSQRALAEFCSLGGVVFVAGSFRFGEQAGDLPPPSDPQPLVFGGVAVARYEYGAGAIYRADFAALRDSPSARRVILDALFHHAWFGAAKAPGGPPPARALPPAPFAFAHGPGAEPAPGLWFFGPAGLLLLACIVGPFALARAPRLRSLLALPALGAALAAAGLSLLQPAPESAVETFALVQRGPRADGPASLHAWVAAQPQWRAEWQVALDASGARILPRPVAAAGWPRWEVDVPLAQGWSSAGDVKLAKARIGEELFRDYAKRAREGSTAFASEQALLLEWWLENNAWRGREAGLAPAQAPQGWETWLESGQVRLRGAVSVTAGRVAREN